MVMSNSVFVMRQLSCASIDGKINACIEIIVAIVAYKVLVSFDIGADFDMETSRSPLDRDSKLLQPIEETWEFSDLRLDVFRDGFSQFHVFCANCDEHVSLLHIWWTIGRASATAAARIPSSGAKVWRLGRRDHARPSSRIHSQIDHLESLPSTIERTSFSR